MDGPMLSKRSVILNDVYQVTMAYAYFVQGMHEQESVFEYYFRTAPFGSSYCILQGVHDLVSFLSSSFWFTQSELDEVKALLTFTKADSELVDQFIAYLANADASTMDIVSFADGSVVFPNEPIVQVKGPLALVQLLETPLLNTLNFPTLLCTKANRLVRIAGEHCSIVEFGLRRAQGAEAGLLAAKYAYAGGANGSSNLLACEKFGIPYAGTHAHSFVQAFRGIEDLGNLDEPLVGKWAVSATKADFVRLVESLLELINAKSSNRGELAAFISFAFAFPGRFVALVDTYNTLRSGVPNYIAVACALLKEGFKPVGIRIDSGDLGVLSRAARRQLNTAASITGLFKLGESRIFASNDLDERAIAALGPYLPNSAVKKSDTTGHCITDFGVGTKLVTCYDQPALGGVFKLCSLDGRPCFKISEETAKSSMPFSKQVHRVIENGEVVADIITLRDSPLEYVEGMDGYILAVSRSDFSKKFAIHAEEVQEQLNPVWHLGKPTGSVVDSAGNLLSEKEAVLRSRALLPIVTEEKSAKANGLGKSQSSSPPSGASPTGAQSGKQSASRKDGTHVFLAPDLMHITRELHDIASVPCIID